MPSSKYPAGVLLWHMALSTPSGGWVEALSAYATWQRASHTPLTTMKQRNYQLRRFALECGAEPETVETAALLHHLEHPTWGAVTRRSVRSALRSFFGWMHATGQRPSNPAALLPSIRTRAGVPRPAGDEAVSLGLHTTDPRVVLMVRIGARAGLRCGEIAMVRGVDVYSDVDAGGTRIWSLLVHGKGGKERSVPIADDLATAIRRQGPSWTFPGQIDGHLSAHYVSKLVSHALGEGTTGHQLRHRFATRALRASGGNLRVVQELLGHASVASTQIYTAVADDELRRAALAA